MLRRERSEFEQGQCVMFEKLREREQLLEFEKGFLASQLDEERAAAHREQENLRERIRQHAVSERKLMKEVSTLLLEREALKKEATRTQKVMIPGVQESHAYCVPGREDGGCEGEFLQRPSRQQDGRLRQGFRQRHQQRSLSPSALSGHGAGLQAYVKSSRTHAERLRSEGYPTSGARVPHQAIAPTELDRRSSPSGTEHGVNAAVMRSLLAKSEHLLCDGSEMASATSIAQKPAADSASSQYMRHMQAYARRVRICGQGGA